MVFLDLYIESHDELSQQIHNYIWFQHQLQLLALVSYQVYEIKG